MMETPICDFVRRYSDSGVMRLHMPGHKGVGQVEQYDITEIKGADSLYEADGIIAKSERNASELFGCDTFYSTEGSSQCIRAMLYLATIHAKENGRKPVILAGRNAHKTFLSAAALIDFDVEWIFPEANENYLSCLISSEKLENILIENDGRITAIYITSPDYLGNVADIKSLSEVCHKYGAILLVDNAHGAYLRFLNPSQHPMDLGADMCCDSAHKTLSVLTGGAYLHIASKGLSCYAKNALALFGSTSPSYLILQSLDKANKYLSEGYADRLNSLCEKISAFKAQFVYMGYILVGDELTKITIDAKKIGYYGFELADLLRSNGIECEFADPDFVVLMLTPENIDDISAITEVFVNLSKKKPILNSPPLFNIPERVLSIREAMFSPFEMIDVEKSVGRIAAAATVGCPPAVPVVVCGEKIRGLDVECFKYYGIEKCAVLK